MHRLKAYQDLIQAMRRVRREKCTFYHKSICYQDRRHWKSSEVLCHQKGLVKSFQQSSSRYFGKTVLLDLICVSSGRQVTGRPGQGSVLSLRIPGKSKGQFLRVLQDKVWLEKPDIKEFFKVTSQFFSTRKSNNIQAYLKCFVQGSSHLNI